MKKQLSTQDQRISNLQTEIMHLRNRIKKCNEENSTLGVALSSVKDELKVKSRAYSDILIEKMYIDEKNKEMQQ